MLGSKVEIRLFKAETITWTSLEFIHDKKSLKKINIPSGILFLILGEIEEFADFHHSCGFLFKKKKKSFSNHSCGTFLCP